MFQRSVISSCRRYSSAAGGSSGGGLARGVLISTGLGATGLGAYYYYDPNAEAFKYARSALGLETATNCEPTPAKKPDVVKISPVELRKPLVEVKKPVVKKPESVFVAPPPPVPAPVIAAPTPVVKKPDPVVVVEPPKIDKVEPVATPVDDKNVISKSLLITALRAQQEAITESYDNKIKVLTDEFNRKVDVASQVSEAERFVDLKAKYNKASASLAAIEQGIEARVDQNEKARVLRSLWASVNGLYAVVNHPEYHGSTVTVIDKSSLKKHVKQDEFVDRMINSLTCNEIHSMDSLKTRFYDSVEPVCKNTLLIQSSEGFSLWKYALGSISKHLVADIPGASGNTTNRLAEAKIALERGDLVSAAVAVNKLTGLSREVASDWLSDARRLLETNQTLFVLMTYAASNNVF